MIKIKKIKVMPKASYIFIETDLSLRKGQILKMIYNPHFEENPKNFYLEVSGIESIGNKSSITLEDIGYYRKVERVKSDKMFDLFQNAKIEIANKDEVFAATREKHYC